MKTFVLMVSIKISTSLHDKLIQRILIVLQLRHDQMIQQIFYGSIETSPDDANVSIDSLSLSWSGDLFV